MTPIWYEYDLCIYDLSKVQIFDVTGTYETIALFFEGGREVEIHYPDELIRDAEYERIKKILNKIH